MKMSEDFLVSWVAPVIPSVSLAGVPLHASVDLFESVLVRYLIDDNNSLYKFDRSPILRLSRCGFDEKGDGGYSFFVFDCDTIGELEKEALALTVMIKSRKIYAIKVYDFSFSGEPARELFYKGTLPGGVGLGDLVIDILPFTTLDFDEVEEWFYTDGDYDGLEITGWGVSVAERPDQLITALCVISAVGC